MEIYMHTNCQVCGNPVFSARDYGTESDGRLNRDYCSNCYRGGHFYAKDWTYSSDTPMPAAFNGVYGEPNGISGAGIIA
jgi:ribosomal protein L37E